MKKEDLKKLAKNKKFIYVKLMRSIRSILENSSELLEEYPKDSDGSAKVALIAIDRSMVAWAHMHNYFPSHQAQILSILAHLDRLNNRVETIYPEARNFIRPGFDEINPDIKET
jgi:hypothetical protein